MSEFSEFSEVSEVSDEISQILSALKELKDRAKLLSEDNNEEDNYVLVRTYAVGVFAGILDDSSTETVKILRNARRIWKWEGAASLSELSSLGTANPEQCKFPAPVDRVELTSPQGFEILQLTPVARKSIYDVPVWTSHE